MASAILQIVVAPLTEIAKQLGSPLKTQVGYFVKYRRNIKLLRAETEELRQMVESTSCAIDEARCRGKAVTNEIESWLREVEKTIFNVQNLQEEDTVICCINLRKIYVKSKMAVKLLKIVNKLKDQVQNVPISGVALPPRIDVLPLGDYEIFEATKVAMERITVAFGRDNNKVIGVYGMGGVGKTSIIKEVAKHSKMVMNMFDDVAIATVSSNPVSKIQRDIAECLGMHLEEKSEDVRSMRLADRLRLGRRTLIILDDVWERVDFPKLGIPSWKDRSNCKIAITTRNRDVCSEMDCNISIELKPLSQEDSWSLFKKASGDVIESVDLRLLAEEIVRECGGLPIALVTIGRVLKNKEPRFWEDAVYELKQSRPLNIKGMHEKVFAGLKISFDQFQREESKLCFLYSSLFPDDHDVNTEDLLRYGIGEGLFSDVETVDEARNRVHSIISNLQASCLLLSSPTKNCAKMHPVYRDLAIAIATSNDYSFMVKASSGLEEWPRKPKLEYVMRLSLINNKFTKFIGQKEYPELILLLLQNNTHLQSISDEFFAGMTSLKVLDLSNIPSMVALPPSLSSLTGLRTLCVENNNLEDGSPLGGLISLEILSLRKSTFSSFPEEIRRLTNLRLLDMTDTQVGSSPSNVISNLAHLEELYMRGSYDGWGNSSLAEIFSLQYLNTLHIDIAKFDCLTEDVLDLRSRLKKFRVHIGDRFDWHSTHDRSLCFNLPGHLKLHEPSVKWVKRLLQTTLQLSVICKDLVSLEQLQPECFQSVKNLQIQQCGIETCLSTALSENFRSLQRLEIFSCPKLDKIFFSTDNDQQNNVFPLLSTIHIRDSPRLTALWRGVNFRSLKHLKIEFCGQIKTLFSISTATQLTQLQHLEIANCDEMEVMICHEASGMVELKTVQTLVLFPELQSLKLIRLKKMGNIIDQHSPVDFPNLQHLTVLSCPSLRKLPFGSTSLHKLVEMRSEKKWLEELEFLDSETRLLLRNCFSSK